ncbi:MAG: WG repeat-containing protein [Saprospiraceae bacterium]|nr:WG repeat-containing protein [Saprospiraceae bacterium]
MFQKAIFNFLLFAYAQAIHAQLNSTAPELYLIVQRGKYGYIDKNGVVKIQPAFHHAGPFSDGLAPARKDGLFGFIDLQGKFVIEPQFDFAQSFNQGKAVVWLEDQPFEMDTKGNKQPFKKEKQKTDDWKDPHWDQMERLEAEAQKLGFEFISEIYKQRRFAKDASDQWFITDARGKKLNVTPFEEVLGVEEWSVEFEIAWPDDKIFVITENGIGAINGDGQFVIQPTAFEADIRNYQRIGDVILLEEDISVEHENYNFRYGFWNWRKEIFVAPKFHQIETSAFLHGGLIAVEEEGRKGYINEQGKYVWQAKEPKNDELPAMNIDYMLRGCFYAASPHDARYAGYGGWGTSGNQPIDVAKGAELEDKKMQIKLQKDITQPFFKTHSGFGFVLANTTSDTLVLEAQDSRLNMTLQAKDKNGAWKNIMYLPSSWCGNSYHQVFLAPGKYWNFTAPEMTGSFATKLRIALELDDKKNMLYSDEFDGGVNPAQFWRKPGYSPGGLMDPYDD